MPVIYPTSTESNDLPRVVANRVLEPLSALALKEQAPAGSVYLALASFSHIAGGVLNHFRAGSVYILDASNKASLLAGGAPIQAV